MNMFNDVNNTEYSSQLFRIYRVDLSPGAVKSVRFWIAPGTFSNE